MNICFHMNLTTLKKDKGKSWFLGGQSQVLNLLSVGRCAGFETSYYTLIRYNQVSMM